MWNLVMVHSCCPQDVLVLRYAALYLLVNTACYTMTQVLRTLSRHSDGGVLSNSDLKRNILRPYPAKTKQWPF